MHRRAASVSLLILFAVDFGWATGATFLPSTHHWKGTKLSSRVCHIWSQWAELVLGESEVTDAFEVHEIKSNSGWASPRAWLQSMQGDDTAGGVYSVLRCDYRLDNGEWKIWGLDFHLRRLQQSFSHCLVDNKVSINPDYQAASRRSRQLLNILLENIAANLLEPQRTSLNSEFLPSSLCAVTVMVTLFWQSIHDNKRIVVRGHSFSTGVPVNLWEYNPEPVVASLAMGRSKVSPQTSIPLPNRYSLCPEAKLTSWIRRRRPLEQTFQKPHIGEVLLLRQLDRSEEDKYEILEGLTSNVFFVYPEGMLRTASRDVLLGFGRHLVLEATASCEGLQVDDSTTTPITLDDAPLWQEIFLTSSIKLVVPVCQILVPIHADTSEEIIWKQIWSTKSDTATPFWPAIRTAIIHKVHSCDSGPATSS
jgi:hypothetical protein